MSRTLKSNWMILVAVVVVAIAGFAVYRLNGIFGSEDVVSTPDNSANDTKPFNPKRVLLEVWGPPGATASISYLDINAQPQHAVDAALPWTYDVTTTQPTVFVNVQAQGDGDSLSCRITIDDAVKDERTVNQLNAYTFCLDKSG
ncbi:MmpS family protein [Mycolicibacterium sp. CAU 1645]|uniref:MmpS family protein n=1 Tax=Mycolicibacterium arenosum TaxID=2952157 RepID=A0ABT1LX05_9MYCO|nr:MmpS family protein [Mycolicibacterium sp. CAU 1645]